jgi:hypothetical protein
VHASEGDLLAARFWLPADEDAAFDDDGEVPEAVQPFRSMDALMLR